MFHDSIIAAIRTGVAALVGLFIAYLVSQGFELDDSVQVNLTTGLTVIFTAGYNLLVILLEKKVNPNLGVLLGIPKSPSYETKRIK